MVCLLGDGRACVRVDAGEARNTNGILQKTEVDGTRPRRRSTQIGPVVALAGTLVVSWFVVAAVTVAVVPLIFTVLELSVALKFWPWIVTVWPMLPCAGEKLKIASPL